METGNQVTTMISHLLSDIETIDDTAVYLRKIVRVASILASESDDPVKSLKKSVSQIQDIDTSMDDRLASTQDYAIRVLKFRQRMYEEILNRDLRAAPMSK